MFSFFTSVWNSGNEYQALFLSTSEPTNKDGSTRNRTKSICDPFVFNTVVSRARSVVVSAGNPFTLLRKESHTVKKYGDRAKCWSNYLKLCIENETISAAPSLGLSEEEWQWKLKSLKGLLLENSAFEAPDKRDSVIAPKGVNLGLLTIYNFSIIFFVFYADETIVIEESTTESEGTHVQELNEVNIT